MEVCHGDLGSSKVVSLASIEGLFLCSPKVSTEVCHVAVLVKPLAYNNSSDFGEVITYSVNGPHLLRLFSVKFEALGKHAGDSASVIHLFDFLLLN